MKALDRLEDCRDPARFVQWFLMIVRNRSLSHRSYRKLRAGARSSAVRADRS